MELNKESLLQVVLCTVVSTVIAYLLVVLMSAIGIRVCVSCNDAKEAVDDAAANAAAGAASGVAEAFHDYGGKQRRYVGRSDTGADERDLATRRRDAIAETLVGSRGTAPAFYDGGIYNIEGERKDDGTMSNSRASQENFNPEEQLHEGFNEEDMLHG